jgi:hypothetical protein
MPEDFVSETFSEVCRYVKNPWYLPPGHCGSLMIRENFMRLSSLKAFFRSIY